MIILPVPKGRLAADSDARQSGIGGRAAPDIDGRVLFGRALQSDHASTFVANACRVPIDSAVFATGACARAGRVAAPVRG
ncbi:hypothetical protein [Caballeronia sp. Lep1P3]|uniref:hypothetical protein n=1 Tax=Caballeronia sp. Lep1P3 TaxID=2878150 RepID=UPI001FD5694D|nr:hypothetical protein [Caballeronia sp. Lep1P3]